MSRLSGRVGALAERPYRLLFTATTITTLGDALSGVALAFAVLEFGSATDLGLVIGARQAVEAAVVVAGGVVADRLPRNLVLVGASLVQGAAQAVTAALVLGGTATVGTVVLAQAVYGLGRGVVIPAEVGLVPQTVSPARLQQANALQGLTRNVVFVLGPAAGGALVVAGSPGIALAADAASFLVAAAILTRIRLPRADAGQRPGFVRELRDGWGAFTARRWLWASVLMFGIGNVAFTAWGVLGPLVAKQELGGAGAWGTILAAGGLGAVAGGVLALRFRPARPLVWSVVVVLPHSLGMAALALGAPVWGLAALSALSGAGIALHLALWFTTFQQQVPAEAQSRVSSYDALGSFVLMPLGFVAVGPLAEAIGVDATLVAATVIGLASSLAILTLPSVWAIRAPAAATAEPPAGA